MRCGSRPPNFELNGVGWGGIAAPMIAAPLAGELAAGQLRVVGRRPGWARCATIGTRLEVWIASRTG
jgi:hypothetical protein